MRKVFPVLVALLTLYSCSAPSTLYYWGGTQNETTAYENLAYLSYEKQTPKSICDLVALYEDMVTNPGGARRVPPPGICAEYGYLLLQPETATVFMNNATNRQKRLFESSDYVVLFRERGKELLEMEIRLYPESVCFIRPILKRIAK